MLDCTDVNKLIKSRADERRHVVRLVLFTQWQLDCLKQIEGGSRMLFPTDQEEILLDTIKAEVKTVKIGLIQSDMRDLKFIGIILRDYKVGENVNFNKFLVESLFSSYKSISEEMSKKTIIPNEFIPLINPNLKIQLDQYLDSTNKAKIDSYLNTRRDADSLYTIYSTIESVEETLKRNGISIEVKRLALQRVFHITGEYLKNSQMSPNLSPNVKQSLEEKGIPTKALSKYRDTLAHHQIFPLIKGDDNEVKKLFNEYFLPIQEVIRSTIIDTEDRFVQNIIKGEKGEIDTSVVERLEKSKSTEGVQGLEKYISTIMSEDTYRSMNDKTKKFVDEVYQTVRRMKSVDFPVDPVKASEGEVSEKKSKIWNSIIEYINKGKYETYDKLRDVVAPSLETYVGGLENPHGDVLKITKVIDRLSYKDSSSPDNSILDDFLSLPILKNIKEELERYFDARSFKNNDAYSDFKDSKPDNLINLLNNIIRGENSNKEKLIGFFESIGKSQNNYIPPEEYERLVEALGIKANSNEKLLSYSVSWRKEKCVDLLNKNPPALKMIYDSIVEGKSISSSVYDKLAVESRLPEVPPNTVQGRVELINQKIEELYMHRTREECVRLTEVNDPYAVESQIINIYSLSEKAIDKRKANRKRKRGEKKKFEMRKLRNYLSHGDPLISIEDHKNIARQLVELKDEEKIRNLLKDGNITPEKIEDAIDRLSEHTGITNVRGLLCPSGHSGRSTRSASESCLTWEEIDKFNEGGAENRDPDNIIIDSEKFMSSISSELEANEGKFSNFIALASESEVIGDHTSKVNMLTDNHRYLGHLERVEKVCGIVMHGMLAKNLVGDLLRGDYKDLAINLGFVAASSGLEKVAEASIQGAESILKRSELLGNSLRIASPFISRAVTGFIAWDLFSQVKEYRKGDKDALVPIIGDSIQIVTDAVEIGIEIAEGFEVLGAVSTVTGPIGMAIGAVVFIGTDVYMAVRTVEKIDEYIHLTGWEKFAEGFRAFFGIPTSPYIEKLIEEKNANNQAVKEAKKILKDHPHIQRYVFASMRINSNGEIKLVENTKVLLDEKKNNIKWSRTRPDNLEGIDLFCLPEGDWESVPDGTTYYCDGAIGVEYTNDRTGNYTLFSFGDDDGNKKIQGFPNSSNIFVFGDGNTEMTGGDKDDDFIVGRMDVDVVHNNYVLAILRGGRGINRIDVSQLIPHYMMYDVVGRNQVYANFREGFVKGTHAVDMTIENINEFLGKNGRVDEVVAACDTKYVDGGGGENKYYLDSITIPKDDTCSYDTKVAVNPYTTVTNYAASGNFLYFVNGEKGKDAYIQFGSSLQSNNTFSFNYTLTDVAAMDKSEENITFSFVKEFHKKEQKINVNSSFNLTISGGYKNITAYYLTDRTKILVGQNNVYAMQNTEKPIIDSLVKDYTSLADKLQMYIFVHSNDEVLAIGYNRVDVLMNDPNARASHLVGGGGENVFVIISGHEKLTLAKLPISDVVIYDLDQENKIDTLDLRQLKKQLKKDIDGEINTDVSKIDSDLLINISLNDASKKEVVIIRLKGALENNWYKRLHIVIDTIFVIEKILDNFELLPQLLNLADNSKTIYVINPTDVAEGGTIRVNKKIKDYTFARDRDALVITNPVCSNVDKDNLFTIILNDFYYGNNQDRMQSFKIEFNDQKIFLRKGIATTNFSTLKREHRIYSYRAVMHAIKEQKLIEAIEENNIGEVKDLIDDGVGIETRNKDRQTPLHFAAKSGNLEIVKYLIEEKGADVHAYDNSARACVHYAIISGHLEVVKYFMEEKGFTADVSGNGEQQCLHFAADSGHLEIVKYLIEEKGADVNATDSFYTIPLHLAAKSSRVEVVKYLIEENGANLNARNSRGMLPLHYAAEYNSLDVVKYLIEEAGAEINWTDDYQWHSLHYAAIGGNVEVVKYFIEEKGINVNLETGVGVVPLHFAAKNNRLEIVKYLIEERDADINVKDGSWWIPLHYAAAGHNLEVIKYLIEEKGANINVTAAGMITPFHNAAESAGLEMVIYLIEEKNINVNVKSVDGRVPLHLAATGGNLGVIKYFVEEKNVNVNVKTNDGRVPLHFAVFSNKPGVVKYFVEDKNVDINIMDNFGVTPLHIGAENGHPEIVRYLVEEQNADVNVKDNSGDTPVDIAVRSRNGLAEYLETKLNEKGEKPQRYNDRHSLCRLLTTDSSNQPEIATSNENEKSSRINDLNGSIVKLQESSAPLEAASSNHPNRHERRKRHNDHSGHEDGMPIRMHRVRHRHRRVQKRNVKYQDSHDYIEQPEIAISSGTRPSSWINGLLDWIKEKSSGFVSSVADKFAAKESEDSKSNSVHTCSVRLEKMHSATIPNIPQSRKLRGVPKGNIPNTSWSGWSSNREKVTSNVTDAPEMNTTVLNNALILGDLAVRLVNGTRHKQPIHENLLSLREKSMRFIDENMIMRTIQQGKEKFGGLDTNMDV